MSLAKTVNQIREIIRETFCGKENYSFGFRDGVDAMRGHLVSYLNAIDHESVGPPDLIGKIEGDLRLKECKLLVEQCRCGISKEMEPDGLSLSEGPLKSSDKIRLANLLMIPEQLEAAQFSMRRVIKQTSSLIKEVVEGNGEEEREERGLSEFAQLEIREICQRLNTITVFTACLMRESPSGFPGETHISHLSDQLAEFVGLAMDRHVGRLLRGDCRLGHDMRYRIILDSFGRLGYRLAQIACHWSASERSESKEQP
ncbi:MAG: hypothetical protein WCE90_04610 [Candidatus Zixiibacteriota bacterium]